MTRRPVHPLLPVKPASEYLTTGVAVAGIAVLIVIAVVSVVSGQGSESAPESAPGTVGHDVFVQADDDSRYYGPTPGEVASHVIDNRPSGDQVAAGLADLGRAVVAGVADPIDEIAGEVGR